MAWGSGGGWGPKKSQGGDQYPTDPEDERGEGGRNIGPPGFPQDQATTDGAENYQDPGGYWEYPNFGGPAIWHSASFSHPGENPPNMGTFNPSNGNSNPYGK